VGWGGRLDRALDAHPDAPGTVKVPGEHGSHAEIDVERVDRIGVRVRGVRVLHDAPRDVATEAERLAGGLVSLPHRVQPIEVDPGLGGAILRSRPGDMRRAEHWQVDVSPGQTGVTRQRVGEDGVREQAPWDLTRETLGRVLEELEG
jgi:hypothetical protein